MEVWKAFLGSLVRYVIAIIVGILVSHDVVSEDVAKAVTDSAVSYVVLFIIATAPLVWAYLQKRYASALLDAAIKAEPGSTISDVKAMAAERGGPAPVSY